MSSTEMVGLEWRDGGAGLHGPLRPREGHVWAWEPGVATAAAVSMLAHPGQNAAHQALAIESLSCAYAATGDGNLNFIVRNVSDTDVFNYAVFVAVFYL